MFVRQRLGVDVLRMQLSKQLVELTQRELPEMQKTLDRTLAEVGTAASSRHAPGTLKSHEAETH